MELDRISLEVVFGSRCSAETWRRILAPGTTCETLWSIVAVHCNPNHFFYRKTNANIKTLQQQQQQQQQQQPIKNEPVSVPKLFKHHLNDGVERLMMHRSNGQVLITLSANKSTQTAKRLGHYEIQVKVIATVLEQHQVTNSITQVSDGVGTMIPIAAKVPLVQHCANKILARLNIVQVNVRIPFGRSDHVN